MTTRAIVVGSGIAGMTAALHAHEDGCRVTIVTKGALVSGSTPHAQGGIAAVTFPDDSHADHVADTLSAAAGLAERAAVEILVEEGTDRVAELITRGVAFDRDETGAFRKGLEAAHSYPRVLHAGGDATGAAIAHALARRVRASEIDVLENTFLEDLSVRDGRVVGVRVERDGAVRELTADAVVLATGGAGQLFAYTSNPAESTGDGIAAAIRAGAACAGLEFIQFHPTVLAGPVPFLISEAVRGEGAVLRDERGERFALDAHPDGELAPRDVVARAIAQAMARQRGRPVVLDATALGDAFLRERFPTIDAALRSRGFDWARAPIPVAPAAHYLMGGIASDLEGRTSIPGLYAVGECAWTGVHGANRLASNSLLEGAVFGARAGDAIRADSVGSWRGAHPVSSAASPSSAASSDTAGPFSRTALQELMWRFCGLQRDATGLSHAASVLARWRKDRALTSPPPTASGAPSARRGDREDEGLLLLASAVVAAAAARTSSAGAHFRIDDAPSSSAPCKDSHALSLSH